MGKFTKTFTRRKSSGNVLEEIDNPEPPVKPQARARGKSIDSVSRLNIFSVKNFTRGSSEPPEHQKAPVGPYR
jgi:hypothetical protein